MKKKFQSFILALFLLVGAGFSLSAVNPVFAQPPSPTPVVSPTPIIPGQADAPTLSAFLEKLIGNFVVFKNSFINTVEGTLGGYFSVLAYMLAWILFLYTLIEQFFKGEYNISEIGRFTGALIMCLMLLFYCGDVDGDGKRGDIVRLPGFVGYYLAFDDNPNEPTGYFISRTVNNERTKFNENYNTFVENKLMVKINENEMPVRYPGMSGVQTVAAVAIGQATKEQQNSVLSQEFWIGTLFFAMNFLRSMIEIIDFFLLVVYAFGILICSIISPFMFAVFVNPDLRKRFTIPFVWAVLTITIIFPVLSQAFRYFAFLSSNIALGTSGNPVYTFDPTTYTIVANGDPTPMILVAVLMMLISIILLVMSLILSYALAQGRLLQAVNGLIANTFAGLSSVGLGAFVSAASTRISAEGDKANIEAQYETSTLLANTQSQSQQVLQDATRRASITSAIGSEQAQRVSAVGDSDAQNISDIGGLILGEKQANITRYGAKGAAYAEAANTIANLNMQEKEELLKKGLQTYLQSQQIVDDADKQKILDAVGETNLKGDDLDNFWASLPFGLGSAGSTLFSGKAYEMLSGRSVIRGNPKEGYDPAMPLDLSDGKQFSMQDFLEKGIMPQLGINFAPTASIKTGEMPNTEMPSAGIAGATGNPPTSLPSQVLSPVGNQKYVKVVQTPSGDLVWNKNNMAELATAHGFTNYKATGDQRIEIGLEGKTPEEIDAFETKANTYGIATQRQGSSMILSDAPTNEAVPAGYLGGVSRSNSPALNTGRTSLPPVGRPRIPKTLYNQLSPNMSRRAANSRISNPYEIYYHPSQEASFISTGNKTNDALIIGAARTHGVNPNLLRAQFYQESRFKKGAVSHKGATGFAQIMPDTGRRLGLTNLKDPAQSIYGGAKYMRYISDYMIVKGGARDGRRIRALSLAGYNAGEGAVQKYGFRVPPYRETQDYVKKITTNTDKFNQSRPPMSPNRYIQDLPTRTRAEAEVLSKRYANQYGRDAGLRRAQIDLELSNQIARQKYAQGRNIAAANLGMRYDIADNVYGMTSNALRDNYAYARQANQARLQSRLESAAIQKAYGIESANILYTGGVTQAKMMEQAQLRAAEITRQASLQALQKRNMASFTQTVGNSVAHQISELFERASRDR